MGSSTHFASIALVSVLLCGVGARPATAQTKAPNAASRSASKLLDRKTLQALRDKLAGAPADVAEGLAAAERAGPSAAEAAPEIEAILRRGSQGPILEASLRALAALGVPSSSAAVTPYMRHRVPSVRRTAALALARLPSDVSVTALRGGLRSIDAEVRGISAAGLGSLGARDAIPELWFALDHHVPEAAEAIGKMCDPEGCKALVGRVGKVGIEVTSRGLDAILLRERPLSDDVLLAVVAELRALGTPEARRYAAGVLSRWPASGSTRVKQALEEMSERSVP